MAGHHYFAALQSYAVKLVKFKQGTLIEDIYQKNELTVETLPIRNYGACAALCCMWLYVKLYELGSLNRSADVAIDTEINRPFAKIGVELQTEYMRGFNAERWVELTTEMYNVFDLNFQVDPKFHKGANVILSEGASLVAHRPGVLMSLDLQNGKGHAIAMCRIQGITYFFDPNAGEYRVVDLKKFLVAYLKAAPLALGVKITGGHRVAISKL